MSAIHFTDRGSGFPVVFLHGFCETHEIWNGILPHLENSWRVLAADLPGFGKSHLPATLASIDDVAEVIIHWLESIKINRCVMFGHSLGGYVTLAVASKKPDVLASFGLIHSTAYADSEEKRLNRNRVIDFVKHHGVDPFVESFIPPLFANPQHHRVREIVKMGKTTSLDTLIAYTAAMRDRPERIAVLKDFAGSILLVAGKDDRLITVESVRQQALLCKRPVITVLEGVAHMGMVESETQTVQALQSFLVEAVGISA
ncbi:MAG: alpha/beta fold hydrolase [Cyclobacteriaceae bacterium]